MTGVPDIAVVITCRPHQVGTVAEAAAAVDRQDPAPAERVLIPYRCEPPADLPESWSVLRGDWARPADALNDGWAAIRSRWVMCVDAGSLLPPGSTAAMVAAVDRCPDDTAVVYLDPGPHPRQLEGRAERDYWSLRIGDHLRHGAAWRRRAVELVGGWPDRCQWLLDHALALDVTAAGWKALPVDRREIPPPDRAAPSAQNGAGPDRALANDRWQARSLAIVSLHAGRTSTFPVWERFLMDADLPSRTSLYVVDNSGRRAFTRHVETACSRIAEARRLTHVDISVHTTTHQPEPGEGYLARARNLHVARLYASVLPRVREDLVLTLEDDIDPPVSAVRQLGEAITGVGTKPVGAVAAAWDRVAGRNVCGGRDDGGWGSAIAWEDLPHRPIEVGSVGGACTMWANGIVSQVPVDSVWDQELGWDARLCAEARRRGFGVQIHGDVHCVHHTWGVLRTTAS